MRSAKDNSNTPPSPIRTPPGPPPPATGAAGGPPPARPLGPGHSNLRRSLPSTSFVKKAEPASPVAPLPLSLSPRLDAPSRPAPPPPSEPDPSPPVSPRSVQVTRPLKKNYPATCPAPPPSTDTTGDSPSDPHSPVRDPPLPAESNTVLHNKPLPIPPRPRPKSMFPHAASPPTLASSPGAATRPPIPGNRPPPPPRGDNKTLSRSTSEVQRGVKHEAPSVPTHKQQSTPTARALKMDSSSPRWEMDMDMEDDDDDDESIMRELMDFVASERRCSDDLGFDSPPLARRAETLPRNQSTPHTQLSPRATDPPPTLPPSAHSVSTMLSPTLATDATDKPKRARSVRFVKKKPPLGAPVPEKVEEPGKGSRAGGKRFSKRLGLGFKKDPQASRGEEVELSRPVHIPTSGVKWGKSKDAEELLAQLKSEGFSL